MDGIISILKPPGVTSNQVVSDVRHILGEKKAGHLGTLDPAAAGVLPVMLGRATKLFDLLQEKDKEYIAELAFGVETDTQDFMGSVIGKSSRVVSQEEVEAVLPSFRGEISQTAPAYSALKVDGHKMYELARAGKAVPERVRTVSIPELTLLSAGGEENRFLLRCVCTRGTYIRTLCTDIGHRLGVPASMAFLLRTRVGMFRIGESLTIAELREQAEAGGMAVHLVSMEQALGAYPALRLSEHRRKAAMNGLPTDTHAPEGTVRLYAGDEFLGVGMVMDGAARLTVHLN